MNLKNMFQKLRNKEQKLQDLSPFLQEAKYRIDFALENNKKHAIIWGNYDYAQAQLDLRSYYKRYQLKLEDKDVKRETSGENTTEKMYLIEIPREMREEYVVCKQQKTL